MAPSSYRHVEELLAADRCVLLDGATATELPAAYSAGSPLDEEIWGTRALIEAPDAVLDVHRRYVRAGCDVVTTDTWGLASLLTEGDRQLWRPSREPVHWMDIARRGVRLAREAIAAEGRSGAVAVAFSLNGALDTPEGPETVKLLHRVFDDDPPDLILLETLSLIRPTLHHLIDALLATDIPLWLSFRRCRHGLCGVYGQHWGGPEGDTFGRAARRFEHTGIAALLINCIPPDHVDGITTYLRDFTDLPLGTYPNLGYHTDHGWQLTPGIGGHEYATMAQRWRTEGAHIIGGCCGVTPHHIATTHQTLTTPKGTPRGTQTHTTTSTTTEPTTTSTTELTTPTTKSTTKPWTDQHHRTLYPLPVPDLALHPKVFAPTHGSFTVWRYLFNEQIGRGQRCLDVGCGAGLQAIQLARNGAEHVHAIDREPAAVEFTQINSFRNGVAERVSAARADLYSWVPDERYDVIVASLYQTPVDPMQQLSGHRPLDYWGRNLVDHLLSKLPEALAPDGAAYIMQLSILSQQDTAALLARHGLRGEVADYGFFPITEHFQSSLAQIERVEELSDAYHLQVGEIGTMVAYVLKVTREPE